MPREKSSEKLIPKIYRRKYEDLAMFFYIEGQRDILPALTIEKAMYNFFKKIREEDFNIESSMTTFVRIQKEYYENSKTSKQPA